MNVSEKKTKTKTKIKNKTKLLRWEVNVIIPS
jgi:hypothetical protein